MYTRVCMTKNTCVGKTTPTAKEGAQQVCVVSSLRDPRGNSSHEKHLGS